MKLSIELVPGVNLHVFPTSKYKTVHVHFNFKTDLSINKLTTRALLSNMMETNSLKYPTQKDLGIALSNLYGAGFESSAHRYGKNHVIRFNFIFPNEKFLPTDENILDANMQFIQEILFRPNQQNGTFDQKTFKREKEILKEEYDAYIDDKQLYAALRLNQLYYPDAAHQIPGYGRHKELDPLTSEELYETYQEMIKQDQVDILVIGDITEEQIASRFQEFPFEKRKSSQASPLYYPEFKEDLIVSTDEQPVQQAKLNLGFKTDIYYLNENYVSGQVFNGIFGGYPHSKLFLNVREKESLAYYASSSLSEFTGKLTVQTGIDGETAQQTNKIIVDQLQAIQNGDFSTLAFEQTKESLKNSFYQNQDSPEAHLRRLYRDLMVRNSTLTTDEYLEYLKHVRFEDVVERAQNTSLQVTYLLKGSVI